MKKKIKKDKLYLSDRQPLTVAGKAMLILGYVILFLWTIAILWPLFQMFVAAFNGKQYQYLILNDKFEFSLTHFQYLFTQTYYINWVLNTIFIAISSAILVLIIVSFTGYAYSRYRFKGKKSSLMAIMMLQTIPPFAGITAYFTMHSILYNVMPFFSRQMMLILIYSGGAIAANTFILKGYLDSISMELDDAARIDGCSNFQIYRLIIMPIARPMLAIIGLWSFILPFMDYLLPKVLLTDTKSYTLAAGLFTLINNPMTINQPAFAAGGLLTAIPIVIMFIALRNQLVSGLTKGSVKG